MKNVHVSSIMLYKKPIVFSTTKESLIKVWEKLKSESKLYYTSSRKNATQTGGGPSLVKFDPLLEQVCVIMGRGCTGIEGVYDSDSMT